MHTRTVNALRQIRDRLGVTQREISEAIGCTPAHAANMEAGRHPVTPAYAAKLITYARARGLALTFDMIYGAEHLPAAVLQASEPAAPAYAQKS